MLNFARNIETCRPHQRSSKGFIHKAYCWSAFPLRDLNIRRTKTSMHVYASRLPPMLRARVHIACRHVPPSHAHVSIQQHSTCWENLPDDILEAICILACAGDRYDVWTGRYDRKATCPGTLRRVNKRLQRICWDTWHWPSIWP